MRAKIFGLSLQARALVGSTRASPEISRRGAGIGGFEDDVVEAGIGLVAAGQRVADEQVVAPKGVLDVGHRWKIRSCKKVPIISLTLGQVNLARRPNLNLPSI